MAIGRRDRGGTGKLLPVHAGHGPGCDPGHALAGDQWTVSASTAARNAGLADCGVGADEAVPEALMARSRRRFWTCRKCDARVPRVLANCLTPDCTGKRPKPRKPKHMIGLEKPYGWWVEQYGERCGICGRAPSESRRLDRDHDHRTGEPRGLLCHLCNRNLGNRVDVDWLLNAAKYLDR
jgi:hypothetical protein